MISTLSSKLSGIVPGTIAPSVVRVEGLWIEKLLIVVHTHEGSLETPRTSVNLLTDKEV